MSLFTDPGVISLDDLLQFESSLVDVCSTHGIDVRTKIKIATDGIGDKLTLSLLRSIPTNVQTDFYNGFVPNNGTANRFNLNNVLVSPALYRWLCFDSLARVFAEAYNVQLNTRFQGKWTEYEKEGRDAANLVYASGLGIVLAPLTKPASPDVQVGLGTIALSTLFVQTTWVNAAGRESAFSPINAAVLNGFSSVTVATENDPTSIPSTAVGWNVYASGTQQNLSRQNVLALPIGAGWSMPATGLISGAQSSQVQSPDILIPLSGRIQRG